MDAKAFIDALGSEFFTGVPDSLLAPMCFCLDGGFGSLSKRHIVAANEGNSVALAAGYYLSTGKVPVVYMQNSGIGNAVNPIASLLHRDVYAIACIFVVGWRGEPGVHDEPQHVFQGRVTEKLLGDLDIKTYIIDSRTSPQWVENIVLSNKERFKNGGSIAFIVRKGSLEYPDKPERTSDCELSREEALERIAASSGSDIIFSTTGKISRELFEIRERNGEGHGRDFLCVGSMGHCSSMALSAALYNESRRVWCIDGDGAAIMHMGAMATLGAAKPANLIHVVLNNFSHDTVGGMPTVASSVSLTKVARACGYPKAFTASNAQELDKALAGAVKAKKLSFIEVTVKPGARSDLGRPTTSAKQNKQSFMDYLNNRDCE